MTDYKVEAINVNVTGVVYPALYAVTITLSRCLVCTVSSGVIPSKTPGISVISTPKNKKPRIIENLCKGCTKKVLEILAYVSII